MKTAGGPYEEGERKWHFPGVLFVNILDRLLDLMQNPGIKKLFKNRRELSVEDSYSEGGGNRAKAQSTKLYTGKILSGEPHVRSGCNSVLPQ